MSEPCNGWTNYETWLVNLWMDNDQGLQEFFREQAKEIYDEAAGKAWLTREQVARHRFADWLKDYYIYEERPELPGLYGDLINAALASVNWNEIARHYIDAVLEEVSDAASD